jgi:hypothetical protein
VIDVPDRADVHVRLAAHVQLLAHDWFQLSTRGARPLSADPPPGGPGDGRGRVRVGRRRAAQASARPPRRTRRGC